MKHLLPTLLTAVLLAPAAWPDAQPAATPAVEPEPAVTISIENDADSDAARQRLKERIETAVRARILAALEDRPELSDEDRAAIADAWGDWDDWDDWDEWDGLELDDDGPMGLGETFIVTLAILLIFGGPIMLVAIFLYAGHRKRRLQRDMVSDFLTSGQQVPAEVWNGLAGEVTPRSNLHKGMVLIGLGLGILLAFWLVGQPNFAYLGLIPLFVGLAQVLIWKLERGK